MKIKNLVFPLLIIFFLILNKVEVLEALWCVARSEASDNSLKTALDYACATGADCAPLQSNGLCFLPNTMQAHASYAFNSYFQRKGNSPGSCSFAGTATIAKTDPSYGSCVYPSSPNTAGGTTLSTGGGGGGGGGIGGGGSSSSNNSSIIPVLSIPPPPGGGVPLYGNGGFITPGGTGNGGPAIDGSDASPLEFCNTKVLLLGSLIFVFCLLLL